MQWIRTSRNDDHFTDHAIMGTYEVIIEFRSDLDYGEVRIKPFHSGYISLGKVFGSVDEMRDQAALLARAYINDQERYA